MKKLLLFFYATTLFTFFSYYSIAQGVTTSSIEGTVTDTKGEPLPGATVLAIHEPSGTQYGATTRVDGEFNLPAVRVGGPYTITVSFVGYQTQKMEKVYLSLGQESTLDFKLNDATTDLTEVEVKASKNNVLNANRTGAVTSVTTEQIERATSLNRDIGSITRLTPQASTSNFGGFGGKSNLFNNFSVDGAMFNNAFGLSDLPGGQTNSTPISMDAIQEFQISLAPYDVRQSGFTGAGVNAITRSGTNSWSGSVYTFFRNQNLNGKKVSGQEQSTSDFQYNQYGIRLGGPIIKNKVFFFVNGELDKRTDPMVFLAGRPDLTGNNVATNLQATDLDRLKDTLLTRYGYNPGVYEGYNYTTESKKLLARIDWNISKKHKLTLRENYMISSRIIPPSTSGASGGTRGPDVLRLPFSNTNYIQNQNMNSIILELNSIFGNKFSNTLQVGYNMFRDFRESNSAVFPLVDIESNGITVTSFGYEPFSPNNRLDQDHFQFSDHFTFFTKKHILSIGTANEYFSFKNGFTPQFYGAFRFASVDDFYNNKPPTQYQLQYSALEGVEVPLAEFKVLQLGGYIQDEWTPIKRLKLTLGLRVDVPIFTSKLDPNPAVESLTFTNGETIDVSKLPKSNPLWSPRLGFNLDVKGDRTTQIRGGTGIFTGRVPYTWVSGQAGNNGLLFGNILATGTNATGYVFNPNVEAYIPSPPTLPPTVLINVTSRNFKFPQVFRTNLAIDQKLPWDLVATIEGIYTKDINAIFHRNANLADPVGIVDGDGRPKFGNTDNDRRINPSITNAIVLDNTSQGYQWSITGQLQKTFTPNLQVSIAYNYGDARDLTSSGSAIAANAFTGNQIVGNPNNPVLSYTNFLQRHRFIGSLTYRKEYAKHFATSITLFYEIRSGRQYSYTYSNDLNLDGISGNDLMYIPRTKEEIVLTTTAPSAGGPTDTRTTDEIWQQLDQYIQQDPYLSKHRGEYAARNGAVTPFVARLDMRILQDFYINTGGKRHTLQLSFDIQNLGNLLNSNWGVLRDVNRASLLTFAGYEGANNTGRPTFSFPLFNNQPLAKSFRDDVGLISRWQAQIGIRYIFN